MDRRIRGGPGLMLAALALPLLSGGCGAAPPAAAWTWQPGLDAALDHARREDRSVLLAMEATWCPSCHQLEREVFERGPQRLPVDRLVGARIDFDSPEGQALAQRYRVIGLPTTLVLDAEGREQGRVEGYDDLDAYLAGIAAALAGERPDAQVLEELARAPEDPALNAEAGAVRLARGDEAEGVRLLEEARRLDPDGTRDGYFPATRTLGRYCARVLHDYERALGYFREAAALAGDSERAWGYHYWIAMTLRSAGRPEEGWAHLERLAEAQPERAEPPALAAEYLYMGNERTDEARARARTAVERAPTDDWNRYLAAVLAERAGLGEEARAEARRAVELAPGTALYEHLLERLEASGGGEGD